MSNRILFWVLWLAVIIYATVLAPPDQSDSLALVTQLSAGQWQDINPYVVALFNIMGIWPMIYSAVMLTDGQSQSIRAWPFVAASFAVGAFAILPYLALRTPGQIKPIAKSWPLAIANSRWVGVAVLAGVLLLLGYGITQGDWSDFVQQWQRSRFIHVMSLDFCLLCLIFPALLNDDWARRSQSRSWLYWVARLIPLVGPALYLVMRPSLSEPAPASYVNETANVSTAELH